VGKTDSKSLMSRPEKRDAANPDTITSPKSALLTSRKQHRGKVKKAGKKKKAGVHKKTRRARAVVWAGETKPTAPRALQQGEATEERQCEGDKKGGGGNGGH